MEINRETDISRQFTAGVAEKFARWLAELAPVGPATAKKYVAVVKGLLGKDLLFSLDEASRIVKRKNRVYVRAAIVKFIDYMEHEGILDEALAELVKKKKLPKVKEPPPKPREIPSVQEILRVIEALEKEDRMIARFMFFTGCRVHEALSIRLRDINFSTGRVTLYGKGRLEKKPRPAKIPMEFAEDVRRYTSSMGILEAETIFWPNSKATISSKVDMFDRKLKLTCEKVLGKSVGSHDFRRIVATKLLKDTGNIQLVQQILGHEKIETTQRYTKYVDSESYMDQARDIMSNIGGREATLKPRDRPMK